jgi:hypothetical protein
MARKISSLEESMSIFGRVLFYGTLWLFLMRLLGSNDPDVAKGLPTLNEATMWLVILLIGSTIIEVKTRDVAEKAVFGGVSYGLLMIAIGLWWARVDMNPLAQWGLFALVAIGIARAIRPSPKSQHH